MLENLTIPEMRAQLNEEEKAKAKKLLGSKNVHSAKIFHDEPGRFLEALIAGRKKAVFLPFIEEDENGNITDIHCQCCPDDECVFISRYCC